MTPEEFKKIGALLESDLQKWRPGFKAVADWVRPRDYPWLATKGKRQAPGPNQRLINTAGTRASDRFAAGLTEGVVSRTRKWFKLGLPLLGEAIEKPVAVWLSDTEARLRRILSTTNFYEVFGACARDLGDFGNAALWMERDENKIVRFHHIPIGEFAFGVDHTGRVRRFLRTFLMPAQDVADTFGKTSDKLRRLLEKPETRYQPVTVYHCVVGEEQAYWTELETKDEVLVIEKLDGWPLAVFRWDVISGEPYATGPGFTAVRPIRALQQAELAKAKLIDHTVKPPLVADDLLASGGINLVPGGVTYVTGMLVNNSMGVRPMFQVDPNSIVVLEQDIQRLTQEIMEIYYVDLFLMISQLSTVRSASEIVERKNEKITMLGPMLQRLEEDVLGPVIRRTFELALEAGALLDPPAGVDELEVNYISMLHQAQEASDTVALERALATTGNMAAVWQEDVVDSVDGRETLKEYYEKLGVSPKVLRSDKEVEARRAQRAEQEAMAQAMQAAQSAKVLSDTDVGGGVNALEALVGNG